MIERVCSMQFASLLEPKIKSDGNVIHTLEAARWCDLQRCGFVKNVLREVNRGADTDTTGYVAGRRGVWLGDRALSSPRHS